MRGKLISWIFHRHICFGYRQRSHYYLQITSYRAIYATCLILRRSLIFANASRPEVSPDCRNVRCYPEYHNDGFGIWGRYFSCSRFGLER